MQIKSLVIALVAGSLLFASCNSFKSSKIELKTQADSVAYAIGSDMATMVIKQIPNAPGGKDINQQLILAAFTEIINGKESKIPAEKIPGITQSYFVKMQASEGASNLEAGKKFLDENGKRSDVKTTASGLQYEILKEGTGPKPMSTDTVVVNYKGTLIDGKVFDDQCSEGKKPATFAANQVIPGWTEALQLMPVGSKWKIYVPSALAYGDRAMGADIKPNSVLVFEVTLLEIKK